MTWGQIWFYMGEINTSGVLPEILLLAGSVSYTGANRKTNASGFIIGMSINGRVIMRLPYNLDEDVFGKFLHLAMRQEGG